MKYCRWHIACNGKVHAHGYCRSHLGKLERSGLIVTGFSDPGPVRAQIAEHLARGCTAHHLGALTGVDRDALLRILDGHTTRVRVGTATRIMRVPLPPSFIGITRRMQALACVGWTRAAFAQAAGIPLPALDTALCRRRFTPQLSGRVAEGYERFAYTPGPSRRVITHAIREGWRPPLDWDDDIDDPTAEPGAGLDCGPYDEENVRRFMGGGLRLRGGWSDDRLRAARDEAIRRLAGHSAWWISQQVHCSERTVERVQARKTQRAAA